MSGRKARDSSELRRARRMKQINVFPMLMMLIVVVALVIWLYGLR
ncbi:MAG: hypothetical protein ACJ8EY_04560 [Sphingomicrobium sp.]